VTGAVSWTGEAAPRTGASEPVTVPFLGTSQGPLVASSTPRAATGGVIPDTPGVTVGGTPAPSCKPAPSPPTPSLPTAAATMKDATAADGWSAGTPTQPVTFDEQRARLVVRGQGGHQPVDDHGDLPVVATDYSPVANTPSLTVTAATEKRATPDRAIVTSTASRPHTASRGQIAGSALASRRRGAVWGRCSGQPDARRRARCPTPGHGEQGRSPALILYFKVEPMWLRHREMDSALDYCVMT
jgi:hypothetical protein